MAFVAGQKVRASELNDLELKGLIGYASLASGTGVTTSDTIQGEKVTVSVVTGRRYRIHHQRNEANGGAANIRTNRYRVGSGATVTTASTLIVADVVALGGSYVTFDHVSLWDATFTGQATFGVSSFVNSGSGQVDSARAREIWVEDVG